MVRNRNRRLGEEGGERESYASFRRTPMRRGGNACQEVKRCAHLRCWWSLRSWDCRSWPARASAAKPEEVGLSTDRLKRIGEAVQRHIDANNVAGAVTLVARRGRIAHFEARGMMDLEAKKPMPKDGLFRLASMSKPITGVAIMMLVEEGTVRLSDPVSRFIPEFKGLDKVAVAKPGAPPPAQGAEAAFDLVPAARPITIGDLLKHGSGSGQWRACASAANRIAPRTPTDTLATHIPKLAAVPLDFQPGTLWRYSGLAGFDVLSRVVEVVSGQTFDVFLKQRLFDPLGMKDTAFFPAPGKEPRLVTIYQTTPRDVRRATRPMQSRASTSRAQAV